MVVWLVAAVALVAVSHTLGDNTSDNLSLPGTDSQQATDLLKKSFPDQILAFRTLVIPPQAAVMNLRSIGASYGVLTAVFQYGWLSGLIGLDGPVPIVSYVPLFMFAILFGLSMDYEVFLVSQIEEHYRAGEENRQSVVSGLVTSARVITAAAAIMVFVFGSFVLNGDPPRELVVPALARPDPAADQPRGRGLLRARR